MGLGVIAFIKPYVGRLYDRVGPRLTVTVRALLASTGLLLPALSSSYCLLSSLTLFAIGVALITSSFLPMLASIVGKGAKEAALGAVETIKDIGQALGPIATGAITTLSPSSSAFIVTSLLVITAVLAALIFAKRIGYLQE